MGKMANMAGNKAKNLAKKLARSAARKVGSLIMIKLTPIILPIILIIILIISFFLGFQSIEMETKAYEGNNFDGLVEGSVQEKVWWALIDAGYNEINVASIMGNIEQESNFDPAAEQNKGNPNVGGKGLIQWDDRKNGLYSYATSKGKEWKDLELQIEFLLGELKPGGGADGYALYQFGNYLDSWKNSTNLDEATQIFCEHFERAGDPNMENRISAAHKYYDMFKGKSRPESSSSSQTGGTGDGKETLSNTPGIRGTYKAGVSGRTYTEYYQNDGGAWNWEYGCWISSQATIMSGFGCKKTPNQLPGWHGDAQQSTWKDYGGCEYERKTDVNANDMIKYLKQGHALHIRVEGNTLNTDNGSRSFTNHSLTILDYKKENGVDKVYIHDPYKGDNTYGWSDINKVVPGLCWYEHVWKN